MKTIGIDMGTTTISAVVFETEQKKVLESRTVQNGSFISTEHEWERIQDAEMIVGKAKKILDELLELYPDTESVGLTGQMHGIVYLDKNGKCLSPLYTWQDGRGNLPEFGGRTLTEQVMEQTETAVASGYGLVTHLYHCRKNMVPAGSVSVGTIADYFGMCLTGNTKPLLHTSNAASLGFFDSEKGCFKESLIQKLGMDVSILPEVSDEFAVLGKYRGIPVTIALGDNQASFLGSVGMKENTLLLNMGTGGQISVLSGQYFEAPGIEARPFMKGKYLLVGASLCGGRAYAILERFFRRYVQAATGQDRSQYEIMSVLAEKGMKAQEGMIVHTTFNGTRVNPKLRGSITSVSEDNFTPEGLVYGTLEGMARELYDMYQTIYEGTGIRADSLVASGNGVRRNRVLQKIFCEMFKAELRLTIYKEEAACGAAVSSAMHS